MTPEEVTQQAKTLFNKFFNWRLEDSPEFASFIGKSLYDDRLESYNPAEYAKRKETCESFLKEAKKLEALSTDPIKKSLKIIIYELETFLTGFGYACYGAAVNYFEGPQTDFLQILSYMPKETVHDFENIIARYNAFPKQAEEIIDSLMFGIQKKATNHSSSMHSVLDQFSKLQVPVENSDFYKPFLNKPSQISDSEWEGLQAKAKCALQDNFLPGMKKIADFLEKEYLPCCRPSVAANSLPSGDAFYQQCLLFHLTFNITPQEVHNLGLSEVKRISQEMEKVIHDLGSELSIQDFLAKIRLDSQFFFNDKSELIDGYQKIVDEEILPKLPGMFKSIPNAKLRIQSLPESQSGGPLAFYLAGSCDGKRPGVFYVNSGNLKSAPKYEMRSLALHEALPGHHLQTSFVIESPDLPEFQRYLEDRKYFSCPARFPQYSAYGEGWGLYCEYLGKELGIYSDPYSLLGYLSQEIFRACRLVVDTGLHSLGWSMQEAVDYMLKYTASSKENIEKEVNRYVMWPGQACAYKVGEIKIKSLRNKAETTLGAKFCLKEFHDIILCNVGPLSMLEEEVEKYIKEKQN